jgi:hypothetical protein
VKSISQALFWEMANWRENSSEEMPVLGLGALFFGIAYLLGKSSNASLLPPRAYWLSLIGNQESR